MNRELFTARREFLDRAAISASADYMRDNGIDPAAVEAHAGCLGLVKGELLPQARWEFRTDGEALAVVEVLAADADTPVDLAAWPADRFGTCATMFGNAALLGAANVENPASYHGGRPLRVHRHPLGWLRAACEGVVILDRDRAVDALAEAPGRIAGEDVSHARDLARALRHYVDPRRVVAPIREAA